MGVYFYKLNKPLLPNDSLILNYDLEYKEDGFPNDGGSTNVIFNGTFINNSLLPALGYQQGEEMQNDDNRKKYNLPKQKFRMNPVSDSAAYRDVYISPGADKINFDCTVSTSADQIAIAQDTCKNNGQKAIEDFFITKWTSLFIISFLF